MANLHSTSDPPSPLARSAGIALMAGGVLIFLINAILSPLLPKSFAESAASWVFLWRQSAAAVAAMLLLFGSVGMYLRQARRSGVAGSLAFGGAFVGTALLLAMEWGEIFLVRTVALRSPSTLGALEGGPSLSPYDLGAMIAFAAFTLGWLAFAILSWRMRMFSRRGPTLLIAGFFLVPMLGWAGVWGQVVGDAVLGAGWWMLGRDLIAPGPGPVLTR